MNGSHLDCIHGNSETLHIFRDSFSIFSRFHTDSHFWKIQYSIWKNMQVPNCDVACYSIENSWYFKHNAAFDWI